MRRFYAPKENFDADKIILNLEETRHLRDVLRLRIDDKVQVFDGFGKEFLCIIEIISKKETVLKIVEEISPPAPESNLGLTLAVALLKGEKFDLVIQKAVELGVKKFVPLMTKRCDVKLKDTDKKLERWQKIAFEANKQCGRASLMQIEMPIGFVEFIKNNSTLNIPDDQFILFSERGGERFSAIESSKTITAITGAEGGWEDSEIEFAKSNGVKITTFGGRILRAETAAIAISAILQNRFGDLY